MKHIALIGLSGCGKSTLGKMLANELDMPFIDIDITVERTTGMTIQRIFEQHGEMFFRDLEAAAVRSSLALAEPSVIATGGGAVMRPDNVQALRERGFVIFLDRPAELILSNIACDSSRPLLTDEGKLYELERVRRKLYLSTADAVVSNNRDLPHALADLLEMTRALWGKLPDGYAVIGDPIAHTLSPQIHTAVFDSLGIAAKYEALRVPRGMLPDFVSRARKSNLLGFNVTIPHKSDIIPLLDTVAPDAEACGAVNTVLVRNGRLSGFNTDMSGLLDSLREIGYDYNGRRILILGAGGAARGVALKAARSGASSIAILARRVENARVIASCIEGEAPYNVVCGEMTDSVMSIEAACADILINATPLGMRGAGEDFTSLDFLGCLPRGALVCDLVYNPAETALLSRARELGYAAINGLGMLIYQAILADELFLDFLDINIDKGNLYKVIKERLVK
ncbi:MAG: shikimate dehydrogenase [Synergistaceae bacterium]|jgi:shikimate dehydrogenase|nr:shikimate dehydrogenase [Synergistaceae bacterium]